MSLAAGLTVSLVSWTPRAQATTLWRLLYVRETGAEGCPDEMELRLAVAARLGRDPFSSGGSGAILARIVRQDSQLHGSVELVDPSGVSRGKRELRASAATCDDMARAMALSISIAVEPEHVESIDEDERVSEIAPETAPAKSTGIQSETTEQSRDRPPPAPVTRDWSVSASALGIWGVAPGLAWGGALGFRTRWDWLAVGAGAQLVASRNDLVAAGARLDTTLAAGQLEACALYGVLEACALSRVGATWASADQLAVPGGDAGVFLAFGGHVGAGVRTSRTVILFADASLVGVVSPVRMAVDGGEVWEAPPYALAFGAGTRVHFP